MGMAITPPLDCLYYTTVEVTKSIYFDYKLDTFGYNLVTEM